MHVHAGDDEWLILASDGLFANQERGGGGGLSNQQVVDMCLKGSSTGAEQLAKRLSFAAQEAGSTDDVTVVLLQLK
jgi:protein phosphatase 1K